MADETSYPWIEDTRKDAIKHGYTKASKDGAYSGRRWIALRDYKLSLNPLCEHCESGIAGSKRVSPATVVDHITPVIGKDDELFYVLDNLQSLCTYHHRRKTRRDNSKFSEHNLIKGRLLQNDLES